MSITTESYERAKEAAATTLRAKSVDLLKPRPIVRFIKDHPNARLPFYGSAEAAGADLFAVEPEVIPAGARCMVRTGLKCDILKGYELQVRPRSGLAAKHGVTVLNAPGTIDSDYTGPLNVILVNHGLYTFRIEPGERIAQIVVAPVLQVPFEWTEEARNTERGAGGFGSTGTK